MKPKIITPSKFLGVVSTTVVGISFRFAASADPKGFRIRGLAKLLNGTNKDEDGMLTVFLKRSKNIIADTNAVSVVVSPCPRSSTAQAFLQGQLQIPLLLLPDCWPWLIHTEAGWGWTSWSALSIRSVSWVHALGWFYLFIFLCHLGCSCTMVYQSVQSKPLNIVQAQLLEQSKYQFASFWSLGNMHLLTICSVVSLLAMQWEWHNMWKLSQMLEKRATHLHLPRMVAST